jgi:hypothetical protein
MSGAQSLAEWIVANPELVAVCLGVVSAYLVQALKGVFGWQSGLGKRKKRILALLIVVVTTGATQVLAAGSLDWGRLVSVAITAWLSAQGVHALAIKKRGTA